MRILQNLQNSAKITQKIPKKINYKKPIIAAVNGYALGGGCEIATACHIRYASKNALFGQPEVKLGIIAGWGGTQNLPKIVGLSNAIDLLVSGRIINAEEARHIGLVNNIYRDICMCIYSKLHNKHRLYGPIGSNCEKLLRK